MSTSRSKIKRLHRRRLDVHASQQAERTHSVYRRMWSRGWLKDFALSMRLVTGSDLRRAGIPKAFVDDLAKSGALARERGPYEEQHARLHAEVCRLDPELVVERWRKHPHKLPGHKEIEWTAGQRARKVTKP